MVGTFFYPEPVFLQKGADCLFVMDDFPDILFELLYAIFIYGRIPIDTAI